METHVVEIIREKGAQAGNADGALHVKDISAVNGVNAHKLGEYSTLSLLQLECSANSI